MHMSSTQMMLPVCSEQLQNFREDWHVQVWSSGVLEIGLHTELRQNKNICQNHYVNNKTAIAGREKILLHTGAIV